MTTGERPRTDRELRKYRAEIGTFVKETSSSRERERQFRLDAGIATRKGNLRSVYQ